MLSDLSTDQAELAVQSLKNVAFVQIYRHQHGLTFQRQAQVASGETAGFANPSVSPTGCYDSKDFATETAFLFFVVFLYIFPFHGSFGSYIIMGFFFVLLFRFLVFLFFILIKDLSST